MLNIGLKLFKKNHLKNKNQVLYYSFKSNGLKEIENLINNFLNVRNSFIFESVEKGFIKAEVIAFEDYVKYQTETKVKEAGKMRVEGKAYVVNNGDVIHFLFNV